MNTYDKPHVQWFSFPWIRRFISLYLARVNIFGWIEKNNQSFLISVGFFCVFFSSTTTTQTTRLCGFTVEIQGYAVFLINRQNKFNSRIKYFRSQELMFSLYTLSHL